MNAPLDLSDIEHAADLISQADALIVAAGAGLGVDSGLPDFRGTDGFWKAYPALGRERIEFHSIASPDAFRTQPRRAWGFYGHRLNLYRATQPHDGFQILKRWGDAMLHGFGGRVVRINPREFSVPSPLDIGLASGSLNALVEIDQVIQATTGGSIARFDSHAADRH